MAEPLTGPLFDWSAVGGAMPEAYGANAPISDPIARLILGAIGTAKIPGQAYAATQPVTTEQMIKPAADLAGMTTLGAGAVPAEADALRMGIKAYHGSPHDFDAFDLSRIGTGEGAQAYGHGLYFAEAEPAAQAYRDTLQGKGFKIPEDVAALPDEQRRAILQAANAHGAQPDPMEAAKRAQWASSDLRSVPLESIADKIARSRPPPGRMYEVNINADPEHFLDWDKPLSEQPQAVQALANEHQMPFVADRGFDLTGGNLYSHLANKLGGERPLAGGSYTVPFKNDPGAASALRSAGIPGIKYLDQGSRAAGEGSHNYVVFDDRLIDILRKYGIIGGVPLGGAISSGALAPVTEQKT